MKNLKNLGKTLNKNQQKFIIGGISNCPQIGQVCTTGEAVTCIGNIALYCINGFYTDVNPDDNNDGGGNDIDPFVLIKRR